MNMNSSSVAIRGIVLVVVISTRFIPTKISRTDTVGHCSNESHDEYASDYAADPRVFLVGGFLVLLPVFFASGATFVLT